MIYSAGVNAYPLENIFVVISDKYHWFGAAAEAFT